MISGHPDITSSQAAKHVPRRVGVFTNAVCMVMLLLSLSGCDDDDRKPIPLVEIVILADDDAYMLDHQRMTEERFHNELKRIADENRRPAINTVRAYVRLSAQRGAAPYRTTDVVTYCMGLGMTQIENNTTAAQ